MFTLVTDHKPLTTILNPWKGIPSLVLARLLCNAGQSSCPSTDTRSNLSVVKNTATLMDCLFRTRNLSNHMLWMSSQLHNWTHSKLQRSRVIVPKKLQDNVFKELHQGTARMKANARSYVWWPGLDKSLERIARECRACKLTKSMPAVAPIHPWVWPWLVKQWLVSYLFSYRSTPHTLAVYS